MWADIYSVKSNNNILVKKKKKKGATIILFWQLIVITLLVPILVKNIDFMMRRVGEWMLI